MTSVQIVDAPRADHVVHFYNDDRDLVSAVIGPLAQAMADGAAAIVVATPTHLQAFEVGLAEIGLDLATLMSKGRLVTLDASGTLAELYVDGRLDPSAFDGAIGQLIRAHAGEGPVHIYGEMVGLLWAGGDVDGAIRLEQLWNDLLVDVQCSLICAYPLGIAVPDHDMACAHVRGVHTSVLAAAPELSDVDATRRFPCNPTSSRAARRFVTGTLIEWNLPTLADDAALVVAELATNAVSHAASDFTVGLRRRSGGVTIVVTDTSDKSPRVLETDRGPVGGLGMFLIAKLCSAWGEDALAGGKSVWVDLDPS